MPGEDTLPEKDLLGKAATIKGFEYYRLGSECKNQTDIVGKQYRALNKFS